MHIFVLQLNFLLLSFFCYFLLPNLLSDYYRFWLFFFNVWIEEIETSRGSYRVFNITIVIFPNLLQPLSLAYILLQEIFVVLNTMITVRVYMQTFLYSYFVPWYKVLWRDGLTIFSERKVAAQSWRGRVWKNIWKNTIFPEHPVYNSASIWREESLLP